MRVVVCGSPPLPIHCTSEATPSLHSSQPPRSLVRPCPKTLTPAGGSLRFRLRRSHQRLRCSSSNNGSPSSGESDSKAALDAFFLGKAFAEALNERVGSTVGEVLSVIGRWQAEQQKQVVEFQDEVIERAKRAEEKAAMESMEVQGLVSKSSSRDPTFSPVLPSTTNPTKNDPSWDMLND